MKKRGSALSATRLTRYVQKLSASRWAGVGAESSCLEWFTVRSKAGWIVTYCIAEPHVCIRSITTRGTRIAKCNKIE